MDGCFCLMLAGLSQFPVVIGKNQDAASDELRALRERIMESEDFVDDFPEIGVPLQAIGPSTANARLQTVNKKFIGMYIGVKHFALPRIGRDQLPDWDIDPVARVKCSEQLELMGVIRGFKFKAMRPTLAIIDDVEDKDSVRNIEQINKIEDIIEQDIAGMGASAERIARVYLCTTLNRICNAYKYTDRKLKPSWNGRRYRKMVQPPERMDLVQEYIQMRQIRGLTIQTRERRFGSGVITEKRLNAVALSATRTATARRSTQTANRWSCQLSKAITTALQTLGKKQLLPKSTTIRQRKQGRRQRFDG